MRIRGFIHLHQAVRMVHRVIRLKHRNRAKAPAAFRAAILSGDLAVYAIDPDKFEENVWSFQGDAAVTVPAWTFENDGASGEALGWSRLVIDPWVAVVAETTALVCVVDEEELRSWLLATPLEFFDNPTVTPAHDRDQRLKDTQYRRPPKSAYLVLSAALSWADQRIALAGQDFVDASMFRSDGETRDERHAKVLLELLEVAREGRLPMIGRRYTSEFDVGNFETLSIADLFNFARFEASEEALLPGSGIAWSNFEAVSEPDLTREDGIRDIQVDRNALLKLYPPDRETSTIAAEELAKIWLKKAFDADAGANLTKEQLRTAARRETPRLSVRGFDRAWDAIAPSGRSRPGRPRSR